MRRHVCLPWLLLGLWGCHQPTTTGEPLVAEVVRAEGSKCTWLPDSGDFCTTLTVDVLAPTGRTRSTLEARYDQLYAARLQAGQTVWVRRAADGTVELDVKALAGPPPSAE